MGSPQAIRAAAASKSRSITDLIGVISEIPFLEIDGEADGGQKRQHWLLVDLLDDLIVLNFVVIVVEPDVLAVAYVINLQVDQPAPTLIVALIG
jgi:hypothetical protein